MIPPSKKCGMLLLLSCFLLPLAGCSEKYPEMPESPSVVLSGPAEAPVYVSVEWHFFSKEGGTSSHRSTGSYGVSFFDADGSLNVDLDSDETAELDGIRVTIANLTDEPVKIKATAGDEPIAEQTVTAKREQTTVELGRVDEEFDPADIDYEVDQYLQQKKEFGPDADEPDGEGD